MSDKSEGHKSKTNLYKNWISLSGVVVALGSFFAFVLLLAIDIFAHSGNPYMGILAYVVAPAFLILGLAILFGGAYIQYRHNSKQGALAHPHAFTVDLRRPRDRKVLGGFIGGSLLFLFLTALGSYQTYHLTDSVYFCGQTCHTPMNPEYVVYQSSAHARVACTECHIGPGAKWYFKAKINGVHQLYCTMIGKIPRPIPTPLKNLRPARDTCEQCHWPEQHAGRTEKVYHHYLADEENTPWTVRMLLNVGGSDNEDGTPHGSVHWHVDSQNKVEYISSDDRRQEIPWIRVNHADGTTEVYKTEDFQGDPNDYEIRTMDCMDCHNRPSHRFASPNELVDFAMFKGELDQDLPWLKAKVVEVMSAEYETTDQALDSISSTLREEYPDYGEINTLVSRVQNLFSQNIFPEMKADWRAYPEHQGHKDWAGCFRCHGNDHYAEDGVTTIGGSSCNSCHLILAQGSSQEELKNLEADGHPFIHVDFEYDFFDCHTCHNGGLMEE